MEALLEYRQTDVCYGGVRAVRGVSFTLHAGEILGVVGESGCGKSTLLRAAMGLLGPGGLVTGGKILYRGENLPDLSARARRRLNGPELGMIFQSAGSSFCPVRRVGDQLYEMMRAHGPMDKRAFRQQAGALLAGAELETVLRCGEETEVLYIPKPVLLACMERDAGLSLRYAELCNQKLQFLLRRIELLTMQSCRGRVIARERAELDIFAVQGHGVDLYPPGQDQPYGGHAAGPVAEDMARRK